MLSEPGRSLASVRDDPITKSIHRTRLVELSSSGRLVAIEAPSGAGKSTLLAQIAAAHHGPVLEVRLSSGSATRGQLLSRLERSARLQGLSDLMVAIGRPGSDDPLEPLMAWSDRHDERLLVQIDDVHLADDELAWFIAELGDRWPAPHRLVIAGRRVPDPVRRYLVGPDQVMIGPEELRFGPDEVRALFGDRLTAMLAPEDVERITSGCDGWAAAVGLAADRLRRASTQEAELARAAIELTRHPSTVDDLLRELLAPASAEVREAVAQLSLLPVLDEVIVHSTGLTAGMATLTDLGLPLHVVASDRWVFPNAVCEALRPPARDQDLTRAAVQRYLDIDAPDLALEVLRAAGLEEDLAKLLVDLPPTSVGQLDAMDHAAAVAALPNRLLVAHPRILLHLADSYLLLGRSESYAQTVARAVVAVEQRQALGGEQDLASLEVRAVALSVRLVASNDDGLVADADELLARGDLSAMARARLRAAVGRAIATRRTASALREGAHAIDASVQEFQRQGATMHAVACQVIAATYTSIPLGRYDLALEQLDRAMAASPGDPNVRVSVLPYRAFVLIDLGRYAEAEAALSELRRTAMNVGKLGNERSAAFARWAAARMASQQGDAQTTWAACRAVARSEVAVDTGDGAYFRADAAQLLSRVGWSDEAEAFLAEARARDPGVGSQVDLAEYVVAAYALDHDRAQAMLERLDGGEAVEPRMRWRVTLLHAYLSYRAGDGSARRLAAAAFEEAAQLATPDLPMIQDAEVARELLPLALDGSASARDAARTRVARIELFGRFRVERDGHDSEPTGRPGQLIAYLALHDRQANVDRVIEALWPDSEPARGRERLRTVLRRVRRDHEDLIERRDGLLRLADHVTVDVEEFLGFCRRTTDGSPDRERAAAAALAIHRGAPVPGLVHLDWAEPSLRHLEEWTLAMHDVVADETAADGRLDEAIRSLLVALELDPVAEHRYLVAARLLAQQGRRARALQLLSEARRALEDADLQPTVELRLLDEYLRRNPAMDTARAS